MEDYLLRIYNWFKQHKRELPWRETKDPYKIWISEIILQQTRVEQGWAYYQKFIERFPTVGKLASASEEQVFKLWQGLGYYSRAGNLHQSAKIIMDVHGGNFPQTYSGILSLKGVGPYTAAAVASIAFGLPYPVLDGNVCRFLARYFGLNYPAGSARGKKEFLNVATHIMPLHDPGFHNEALMEFGALQCIPRAPGCSACPISSSCFAFNEKKVEQLPVKEKKAARRQRYFYYYLIESGNYIWLEKRTGKDIWKNLYQFPAIETTVELKPEDSSVCNPFFMDGAEYNVKSVSSPRKHILSHQTIIARLIHLEVTGKPQLNGNYLKIHKGELHHYPVPRLVEHLAEKNKILNF